MLLRMILKNLLRHKLRTFLTILGMAVAISAFGFIRTAVDAWYMGVEASSATRIITRNKVSLIFPMPLAYRDKILNVPHVQSVSYANWFQGTYIDASNFFAQFAVDAENQFKVYPEYVVPPDQMAAFMAERNACIVGKKLADRFHWKLGDPIHLDGTIYPGDWDFIVRGIYVGDKPSIDESQFMFHYKYLNEQLLATAPYMANQPGMYIVRIDDPNRASAVSQAIDTLFANSAAETLTETESAFNLGFVAMSGVIIAGLKIVSLVVIFIILLVLANTMAMSARERLSEYAVLKTLGFERGFLIKLIAGETLFMSFLGGVAGVGMTYLMTFQFGKAVSQFFFGGFFVTPDTVVLAFFFALLVGVAASIYPVVKAVRIKIVDGLRYVG